MPCERGLPPVCPACFFAEGMSGTVDKTKYLTLESRKISTGQNYAVWVRDLLEHYEANSICYFFRRMARKRRMRIF